MVGIITCETMGVNVRMETQLGTQIKKQEYRHRGVRDKENTKETESDTGTGTQGQTA